jgi:hypothetical protein
MMTRILAAVLCMLCVATHAEADDASSIDGAQPSEERQAQDKLPQSKSPLWSKLAKAKINYNKETDEITMTTPPEVKVLDNTVVESSGFVMPLDGKDKTKHFLLTRRTPVCLYCPPGMPTEVIEVYSKTPIKWTSALTTVSGKFKLINDSERVMFFELDDARRVQ